MPPHHTVVPPSMRSSVAPSLTSTPTLSSACAIVSRGPSPRLGASTSARSSSTTWKRAGQLGGQLDAGEAAADHGHRGAGRQGLQVPIERLGGLVAVDVERPLDAGQRRPVETAAQRDHQTVVGQRLALGQRHPPRLDVDPGDARPAKRHADPVQHGRQRVADVRAGARLVEARAVHEIRLGRDQRDVDRCLTAGPSSPSAAYTPA